MVMARWMTGPDGRVMTRPDAATRDILLSTDMAVAMAASSARLQAQL